jgi:hypothetical protein
MEPDVHIVRNILKINNQSKVLYNKSITGSE